MILPGFEHRPGVHCGSTALADALRIRGVAISETFAFGLGAGRTAALELTACDVLGAPVVERTAEAPDAALAGVADALARGRAPILATDLARLPYWRARTPFGGHRVVLAGLDVERGQALLADTDRTGLETVSLEVLDGARASVAPPFGAPGRPWLEVDAPPAPRPVEEAVRDALRRQARDMLQDADGFAGVSALERFAVELAEWPRRAADERDRARCFRYAYQVIEVRGTGGGLFRALYARLLREAEGAVRRLADLGLALRMEALATAWSALARGLGALAEAPGREVPPELAGWARALAADERRFFEGAAARV